MLAPGSPTQTVHPHKTKTNGLNGSPAVQSSFLDVPHPDTLLPRPRSASPSLSGGQEEQAKSTKKHKGKSHFNMFRLHKHKKSKKYLKENEEAMMLSQSDGSSLLQQKLNLQRQHNIHPNRRSFSGRPNRSISPIGSTHSFPGFMESEGESEDEFLKTLMNPTNPMGRSPSPSPLLIRTPTPLQQQNSSLESDGGHSGTGSGAKDQGGNGSGENQGDTVSLTASHLDGSNLVSGNYYRFTKLFDHVKRICPEAQKHTLDST